MGNRIESVCSRQSGVRHRIMCKKMKNTLDLLNEIEKDTKEPKQVERNLAWNAMKVFEGAKLLLRGTVSMELEDDEICPVALMNMVFLRQDGIKNIVHECPFASKEFIRFKVRE